MVRLVLFRMLFATAMVPATTAALVIEGVDGAMCRRSLLGLAPAVLITAAPAWAVSLGDINPLGTISRMKAATQRGRALDAAKSVLQEPQQPSVAVPVVDEMLSTPAGLAQLDVQLNLAYSLADDMNVAQLRKLLRGPIFAAFLGFKPNEPNTERQIELLLTFPGKSRSEAAQTLATLNSKLESLDAVLMRAAALEAVAPVPGVKAASAREVAPASADANAPSSVINEVTLTTAVSEARGVSQQLSKLYTPDGCMVCPDNPAKTDREIREEYEAYRIARIRESDESVQTRMLRRPDERDEAVARRLGFRDGELIGGY